MPVFVVFLLISSAILWLIGHLMVKQRFVSLNTNLSKIYGSVSAAPPSPETQPQLMALCVDLMRKQHCNVPFDDLTPQEQRMVLHAHAVEVLPKWMSRYAALWLSKENRKLINQLHHIKSSRPDQQKQYFGAIRRQQQLRSASKG
ncbi:hypothetical protein QTO30_19390 [Yoonia sp. GPGPB17]|uniref:hypothetical protein n=1 Tax=Yoonia sp. GPGPB17 TaxID=3026147 RepID=UPI0030BB06B9